MVNNYYFNLDDDYISHHGILGMKWGIRRFQNKDGSLTSAGKKRSVEDSFTYKIGERRINRRINKLSKTIAKKSTSTKKENLAMMPGLYNAKQANADILTNPKLTRKVGRRTILQRTVPAAATVALGAAVGATPVVTLGAATIAAGYSYIKTFR